MNSDTKLRVIFMGTPDFSVPALQALVGSRHEVIAVYSQPPRPKGRGQGVTSSPVHKFADQAGIPVYTPISLKKDQGAVKTFQDLNADVAVVAAYGLILPLSILEAPKYGCLNIHASLLPEWRGAAPIQRSILAGDTLSGITIMQMEEGLDTGPMISQTCVKITPQTNAKILHDQLMHVGAAMIVDTLDLIAKTGAKLEAIQQDDERSSYAPMLEKSEGKIDWTTPANVIDCQIRGLNPWPGVWCELQNGKRCKVLKAQVVHTKSDQKPGTLLDQNGCVVCGEGSVLELQTIRPEGAKDMDVVSAINGGHLSIGDVLS